VQIRWLSTLTPARYYIAVVRDSFLSGGGWSAQWPDTIALTLLATGFFSLTWLRMRKMQVQA
jgi:ABC-2 type transport system permease protein